MAAPLAGYARVSHVGGRAGDRFHSPTDQAAEIRDWAQRHGHRVEVLPAELDGKGSDASRPILRRAVDGVTRGDYAGLVVAYLSRTGRDLRLMLNVWDEVETAGGAVYFARENIDSTTSAGRLQRNLLASFAQHELEERREGFARSRASAVERGIWKQRQTPCGYRRDAATRRLVPDDRAGEVRAAFEARACGEQVSTLAKRLGMTASGVRQMLANRVYLGELREGSCFNPAAHDPLVTVELFEAAQRSVARPARVKAAPALLAGLVRCSGCGHVMPRAGRASWPSYVCARDHSGARCPEPAAVGVGVLDAYVEGIALAELERLSVEAVEGRGVEQARARFDRAEADLRGYLEAVSPADVGVEAFGVGARAKRQAVDVARDELRVQLAQQTTALPAGVSGADVWETLDGHERNRLLSSLLAAVVVRRAGGPGARVPLAERVRVLAHGAPVRLPERRGGAASGIVPVPLPDVDEEGVLRPLGGEDAL